MATQEPSISELRSNIEPFIGRTDVNGNPVGNRILLALPENEFNSIHPHLEYAQLQYHQSLHESAEKIEYAYFLNKGMVSLVVVTTDGRSVEVGIVGKEGAVGANLAVVGQEPLSRGGADPGRWVPGEIRRTPGHSGFSRTPTGDVKPVFANSGDAGRAAGGL